MRGKRLPLLLAALSWTVLPSTARAVVLYDGSNTIIPTANETPDQSPWLWGYQTFNKSNPATPSEAVQMAANNATTLNTMGSIDDVAGYLTQIPNTETSGYAYVRPDPQTLDASVGFTIGFAAEVNSETHTSNDRAGFSVIAMTNGATPMGIELGFWTNEIFAQNSDFTHGENTADFNTTTGLIAYQLHIAGTGYSLSANGTDILDGSLRDYSAFTGGPPGNTGFPYNQQNLLFFGDDTSEAAASVTIGEIGFLSDTPQSEWQNSLPVDVDNSGTVTKSDVTAILTELNTNGIHALSTLTSAPTDYFDVNGDNMVSPIDALIVIDYLNSPTQSDFGANAVAPEFQAAAAVPEPSTASYAWGVAFCALVGYCCKQCARRPSGLLGIRF